MEFALSPEQDRLRSDARRFAAAAAEQFGSFDDCWVNGFSRGVARALARKGWIGISWPAALGGGGRPKIERLILAEELLTAGVPVGSAWFADRQIGPSLIEHGTRDQQERYLPGILAGESTWCIGMSEPNAGSDLASIRTTAKKVGASWLVNGQKVWTSFAAEADFCYLICRTGGSGYRGLSELVVPMTAPGVIVRPIKDMSARVHFCEVLFTDVVVPAENLVGIEGGAFKQAMRQLDHERGGIDRLVSNHALYRAALALADLHDAVIRQRVAAIEAMYHIGRLLVYREALGQGVRGFSAVSKCAHAPSTSSESPASSATPSAQRRCCGTVCRRESATPRPTRSWVGRRMCYATSLRSAFWTFRATTSRNRGTACACSVWESEHPRQFSGAGAQLRAALANDDRIPQGPHAFDLHLHDVTMRQVDRWDTSEADTLRCAGRDHIAGLEGDEL